MSWVFSDDGVTPSDQVRANLPRRSVRNLKTGQWGVPNPRNASLFGWYQVAKVARPFGSVLTIFHDGVEFTESWRVTAEATQREVKQVARKDSATRVKAAPDNLRNTAAVARAIPVVQSDVLAILVKLINEQLPDLQELVADLIDAQNG